MLANIILTLATPKVYEEPLNKKEKQVWIVFATLFCYKKSVSKYKNTKISLLQFDWLSPAFPHQSPAPDKWQGHFEFQFWANTWLNVSSAFLVDKGSP